MKYHLLWWNTPQFKRSSWLPFRCFNYDRKKLKTKTTIAVKDHIVSLEDFNISASNNSELHLKIKKVLISRNNLF